MAWRRSSVLIGKAPFVILVLVLVPSLFIAKAVSAVLALVRIGNFSPRAEEGYELLILFGQFLYLSAIFGTLSCQFLDVGGESLHLPLRGSQMLDAGVSCFHKGEVIRIDRF